MTNVAKVSIIVPTYNRNWLLPRALQSIKEQVYWPWEIIVVDDCGDDPRGVDEIAEKSEIKNIQVWHNEKNLGLAGSRGIGLQAAKGDYFTFLDDDDILLPLALQFRMNSINMFGKKIVYTRALQDVWELSAGRWYSRQKTLYWDSHFDEDLILVQNIAPCNCVTFSRRAWDAAQNYKPDIELKSGEDYDFWIALSRHTKFAELKLVDCECSLRVFGDNTTDNMTGTRNFAADLPRIFKRWRNTAKNLDWVTNQQNAILKARGMRPEEFGL